MTERFSDAEMTALRELLAHFKGSIVSSTGLCISSTAGLAIAMALKNSGYETSPEFGDGVERAVRINAMVRRHIEDIFDKKFEGIKTNLFMTDTQIVELEGQLTAVIKDVVNETVTSAIGYLIDTGQIEMPKKKEPPKRPDWAIDDDIPF